MKNSQMLHVNTELKYIEYILGVFDNEPSTVTLGEIRENFKSKFNSGWKLGNQYFGILRMIPLILINEEENKGLLEKGDIEKIKIIRNSVAHNDFMMDEQGYKFANRKKRNRDQNDV